MKRSLILIATCLVVTGVAVVVYAQQAYTKNIQEVAGRTFSTLPDFVIERLTPEENTDSYVVLTFDSNGQPVVAREFDVPLRLFDRDGDGIYETEEVITDRINTCQGLWFDGPTMYATCHETLDSEDEVEAARAEVQERLENQTPLKGSVVTQRGGFGRGGGGAGGGGGRGGRAAGPGGRAAGPGGPGGGFNPFGGGADRIRSQNAAFLKVIDNDGDGIGDSVEKVAQLTGSIEDHGPHAIRRGPDGEVMYMTGNNSGSPFNDDIDPNSLVFGDGAAQFLPSFENFVNAQREGIHSSLYRVDVDNGKFYLVTAGNRNTYDFAFNVLGEAFWYDADHEPERGVPWYREVRTVHGIPGGNYGNRNGSGKLPPWYIDTLPPMRDLNRGSPVGVETYQAYAYPPDFFDMLLEADWSRGRLLYTTLAPDGATYTAMPGAPEFVHGEPLNITDLEVGPDGMIYFTTGGRRTEGGFWRIRYTGETPTRPDMTGILAVVHQPQPLSAWGWKAIEDAKAQMGAQSFASELERVARDASRDQWDRVRALYEIERHGPTPSEDLLRDLASDTNGNVRAAAVYVAGQQTTDGAKAIAAAALKDSSPMVKRRAAEALVRQGLSADRPSFAPVDDLYALLNNSDRFVRYSGRIALERTPRSDWADRVITETNPLGSIEGMLAWARTANGESMEPILEKQLSLMRDTDLSTENKLRLLRTFMYTVTEIEDGLRPEMRAQVYDLISPQFPANDERLNRDMSLILAYSEEPGAIEEILAAMPEGDDQIQLQMHYVYALRVIQDGWTLDQKMQLADWFNRSSTWRGGMGGSLAQIFNQIMEFYTDEEKQMAYERAPGYAPLEAEDLAALGGRGFGGFGGRGGPTPIRTDKDEVFDSMLFVLGRGGGGRGGAPTGPEAGQEAFEANCASCHRVGNIGADYGPDLTATQLSRREILESLIWPDRDIAEEYKNTVVETTDGRTIRGLLVSETPATLTLKTAAETEPVEVALSQVRTRSKEDSTIMPDLFDEQSGLYESIVSFLQGQTTVAGGSGQ